MNLYLAGIVIGIIFYIVTFLALNDFILAAIPALLAIIYFCFMVQPQIKKMNDKIKSFRNSYQFINNFIVALSIQPVIDTAFDHSLSTLDEDFRDSVGEITTLNGLEKLKYLTNFFSFHSYQLFVDLVDLWQEHGGDILKMSNFLINDVRECDEYISICQQMHTKKVVEFAMLWFFSFIILAVLRFALSQFYVSIMSKPFFKIGVISVFIFALISCQLLVSKIVKLDIKGWNKYGK